MALTQGDRFGLWVVVTPRLPDGTRKTLCRCDCGTEKAVNADNLKSGKTVSCGCRRAEWSKRAGVTRRKYPMPLGEVWGRLTIINSDDRDQVHCRCECGKEVFVMSCNLTNGTTRSCGCLADYNRKYGPKSTKHGLKSHQLYKTWNDMVGRCCNERDPDYRYYGARGIKVCDRWLDVTSFISDITVWLGPRPDGLTLDRINNNGHYEPGNVRWATRKEQANNRGR